VPTVFRKQTFLSRGVPIEDVAILLGHHSPVITAKYYSHFVKAGVTSEIAERFVQVQCDQA
jgi:hypothetical protein